MVSSSELLVSWHLLEGEKRGGTDVEDEMGQETFTEHFEEFFYVLCAVSTFNLSFLCWIHRFDAVGVYKMTSSTPAMGMSYIVKLGCQAYLGFVSKSWPLWVPEERVKQRNEHHLNEVFEQFHRILHIFYLSPCSYCGANFSKYPWLSRKPSMIIRNPAKLNLGSIKVLHFVSSYPRILCCTCSGTSRPPWPGMQRRSCRDLAGMDCCHTHPRRRRTVCHHYSLAGWVLDCWRPAGGCSQPDRWPPMSFPLHWRIHREKMERPFMSLCNTRLTESAATIISHLILILWRWAKNKEDALPWKLCNITFKIAMFI